MVLPFKDSVARPLNPAAPRSALSNCRIPLAGLRRGLARQEIDFGDERLLAVREGPNVRQSFDGGRLIFNSSDDLLTVLGTSLI